MTKGRRTNQLEDIANQTRNYLFLFIVMHYNSAKSFIFIMKAHGPEKKKDRTVNLDLVKEITLTEKEWEMETTKAVAESFKNKDI